MPDIKKMLQGYESFFTKYYDVDHSIFKDLKDKQSPKILVLSCCDSRVDPAILTTASPGEMFVIRNIANIVPPYEPSWETKHGVSAAIEFAVTCLNIEDIIIMGHSDCGGIKALVDNSMESRGVNSFILPWINIMKSVKDSIPKDLQDSKKYCFCEQESIKVSINNLHKFPWVEDRVNSKKIEILVALIIYFCCSSVIHGQRKFLKKLKKLGFKVYNNN